MILVRKLQILALIALTVAGLTFISLPQQRQQNRVVLPLGEVAYGAQEQRGPAHPIPTHIIGALGQVSNEALAGQPTQRELKAAKDMHLSKIRGKANDSLEPKGGKIVLLTATDGKGHNGAITNLLETVEENREEYCAYHDYKYQFINITKHVSPSRHPVWAKVPAIQEAFELNPTAEWVWWLDTDAIIMTPEIDLASLVLDPEVMKTKIACDRPIKLPNGKPSGLTVSCDVDVNMVDVIVGQDHNGVNAGSILFRRNEWTMAFLDMWADPMYVNRRFERQEQDALNHIIVNHPKIREHIAIVPQRVINAYSVGGDEMGWRTGDLVVHFAGCWVNNECDKRWQDFWSRRQVIEVQD
ncbi:galactosyl transferase GMA12/MNN10 family-domain-containing protein [Lipomyces tetrasporus]|uniref:Galactosyl transferase GMA12/MNN10 family-domain-containing protein n=1 Tax=Lipomyces tetrasporus TaxID=54092 RepID=A0AAD7VT84_9ASCO|nr:galactosyl transferase GMA12/MNN10 family-domain-containing protein [Lipomyces tetrasporus]KAJ8101827.1 galactosyl transferase GMA12/MNN10 family-domain-containing protein [Lipomyces tetrasporus]